MQFISRSDQTTKVFIENDTQEGDIKFTIQQGWDADGEGSTVYLDHVAAVLISEELYRLVNQ